MPSNCTITSIKIITISIVKLNKIRKKALLTNVIYTLKVHIFY